MPLIFHHYIFINILLPYFHFTKYFHCTRLVYNICILTSYIGILFHVKKKRKRETLRMCNTVRQRLAHFQFRFQFPFLFHFHFLLPC